MLIASAKAVQIGHEINSNFKIGCTLAGMCRYPYTCDPKDILLVQRYMRENFYMVGDVLVRGEYPKYTKTILSEKNVELPIRENDNEILKNGKLDFFAFDYYSSGCVSTHDEGELTEGNLNFGLGNPYLKTSEWGWQIDADGLRYTLNEVYDRYQIPLMIVENGLGQDDVLNEDGTINDKYRITYLKAHIKAISQAIDEGVEVLGYTPWSCIDVVSASTGEMAKRYGFIYVDYQDDGTGNGDRYRKDSFYWYKKVIESNGADLD